MVRRRRRRWRSRTSQAAPSRSARRGATIRLSFRIACLATAATRDLEVVDDLSHLHRRVVRVRADPTHPGRRDPDPLGPVSLEVPTWRSSNSPLGHRARARADAGVAGPVQLGRRRRRRRFRHHGEPCQLPGLEPAQSAPMVTWRSHRGNGGELAAKKKRAKGSGAGRAKTPQVPQKAAVWLPRSQNPAAKKAKKGDGSYKKYWCDHGVTRPPMPRLRRCQRVHLRDRRGDPLPHDAGMPIVGRRSGEGQAYAAGARADRGGPLLQQGRLDARPMQDVRGADAAEEGHEGGSGERSQAAVERS